MTCVVLRQFQGERLYKAGETVDVSGWRNAQRLIEQRYLQPVALATHTPKSRKEAANG